MIKFTKTFINSFISSEHTYLIKNQPQIFTADYEPNNTIVESVLQKIYYYQSTTLNIIQEIANCSFQGNGQNSL